MMNVRDAALKVIQDSKPQWVSTLEVANAVVPLTRCSEPPRLPYLITRLNQLWDSGKVVKSYDFYGYLWKAR